MLEAKRRETLPVATIATEEEMSNYSPPQLSKDIAVILKMLVN